MMIENDQTAPNSGAGFTLFVDDNFHYQDASHRYSAGKFATFDEAVAKAKAMVLEDLTGMLKPGMSAKALYEAYVAFGVDPWVSGPSGKSFSAWDYAKELSADMTSEPVSA
jgi:hypothetical protein